MKRGLFLFLHSVAALALWASPPPPVLGLSVGHSGVLEVGPRDGIEDFSGALDLGLSLSRFNLSARMAAQAECSPTGPGITGEAPEHSLGLGLQDSLSGSSILYGKIAPSGLIRRLSSPLGRLPPLADGRNLPRAELAPAVPGEEEFFAAIAGRRSSPVRLSAAVFTSNSSATGAIGLEARLRQFTVLRFEALALQRELGPRTADTWFSNPAPLPSQGCRLGALSIGFSSPGASLAAEAACSDQQLSPDGFYGNLALRAGSEPWRMELAADGSSGVCIGADGKAIPQAIRGLFSLQRRFREGSNVSLKLGAEARKPSPGLQGLSAGLAWRENRSKSPYSLAGANLNASADLEPGRRSFDLAQNLDLRIRKLGMVLSGNLTFRTGGAKEGLSKWGCRSNADIPWNDFNFTIGASVSGSPGQRAESDLFASASFTKKLFRSRIKVSFSTWEGLLEASLSWGWRGSWHRPLLWG